MSNETGKTGQENGENRSLQTDSYEAFKAKAVEDKLTRGEFLVSDIKILGEESVSIKGKEVRITEEAFNSLMRVLGVNKQIRNNIEGAYGAARKNEFVNVMARALAGKDGRNNITVVLNKETGSIVDFRRNALSVLNNKGFIGLFEEVMNKHKGMSIRNMSMSSSGQIDITAINRDWEFQVHKLEKETFNSGLMFSNKYNETAISPFNERLVCTNGMVAATPEMTISLKSSAHVGDFYDKIRNIMDVGYFEEKFKGRVARMMNTTASFAEMSQVYNSLKYWLAVEDTEALRTINDFVPLHGVKGKYLEHNFDLDDQKAAKHKNVDTNMTVWELVNRLTDLASHPAKYGISMRGNARGVFTLQKEAGALTFKEEYDREGTIPNVFGAKIDPAAPSPGTNE